MQITWNSIKTGRKVTAIEFKFPVEKQEKLTLIDNAYIEQRARPGESYEEARKRLSDALKSKNST